MTFLVGRDFAAAGFFGTLVQRRLAAGIIVGLCWERVDCVSGI